MAGKRVCILVLFALAIGFLALYPTTQTQASTLNPLGASSVSSTTPGANAAFQMNITIPAPDAQFSFEAGLITWIPPGFWVADDSEIPNGAGVAEIAPKLTLAIAGRGCDYDLAGVYFDMYDSDTDIDDVLDATDLAFINKDESTNPIPDVRGEEPTDLGADGIPDYLQAYPYLNNILFDPDGPCDMESSGDPNKCEIGDTGSESAHGLFYLYRTVRCR